jgi:DNA invertase Pin-like site-specific DNA recombinase
MCEVCYKKAWWAGKLKIVQPKSEQYSDAVVRRIRKSKKSVKEIAIKMGTSYSRIYRIKCGSGYKNVQ